MNSLHPEPANLPSQREETIVTVSLSAAQNLIPWLSIIVVGLGIFRELYVAIFGTETVMQALRHLALDAENTIAAWYSSHLMSACAILLIACGLFNKARGIPVAMTWYVLAAIFFALSLDEAASFHEEVGARLQPLLNTGGILYFAWVIPGALFVLLAGLYFVPFLLTLPRKTAMSFFCAGGLFVSGALGLELIGGYLADGTDERDWRYYLTTTIEETLEIAGLTVFFWALVDYLKPRQEFWRIQ